MGESEENGGGGQTAKNAHTPRQYLLFRLALALFFLHMNSLEPFFVDSHQ